MTDLAIPTVHLNGTSKTSLVEAYVTALDAVRHAVVAVSAAGPNGRDYYVQPTGALAKAQAEHVSRLERLEAVQRELEDIAVAVSDQ